MTPLDSETSTSVTEPKYVQPRSTGSNSDFGKDCLRDKPFP